MNELETLKQVIKSLNEMYKEINAGIWELREELEYLKADVKALKEYKQSWDNAFEQLAEMDAKRLAEKEIENDMN